MEAHGVYFHFGLLQNLSASTLYQSSDAQRNRFALNLYLLTSNRGKNTKQLQMQQ